ncbi:MAG: phosphatase PAP2 family protein [Spirochaetia bacterium]|nr:phosphatase PAP2 family protein [Spirochaetia bacterium]
MKNRIKIQLRVFAVFIFLGFACAARSDDYSIIDNLFFEDFEAIGSALSDDRLKTGIITASLAAATAVVMCNDENIRSLVRDNSGKTGDYIFDTANYLGDPLYIMAADTLLFLGGEKERRTGQKILEAMAISGLVGYAGKVVFGRERPSSGNGPDSYRWFDFADNAMPSGHTSTAFAWATVLGDSYDIGYITYPLAALTGIARVYKNAHWPSDVLIGAALGILTAKAVNYAPEDLTVTFYDGKAGVSYVY